jgi:hypothetical protein
MVALPAGFSLQEYLALEHQNTIRREYRQGLVYADSFFYYPDVFVTCDPRDKDDKFKDYALTTSLEEYVLY